VGPCDVEGASDSDQPVSGRVPLLAVKGREDALVVGRPAMLWASQAHRNISFDSAALLSATRPLATRRSQRLCRCRTFVESSVKLCRRRLRFLRRCGGFMVIGGEGSAQPTCGVRSAVCGVRSVGLQVYSCRLSTVCCLLSAVPPVEPVY
jgi:hypothetical protein